MKKLVLLVILMLGTACVQVKEKPRGKNLHKAAEANVKLGSLYMQRGMYGAANEKLEKALKQNSKLVQAHSVYALLQNELGKTKKAEKHFKIAIRLDAENSDVRNNYGTFLCSNGKIDQAIEQFNKALLDPLYSTPEYAFANAGACMLEKPDFNGAERFLNQALRRNQHLPAGLFQMSRLYYLKGEYVRSRQYLDRYHNVAHKTPKSLWLAVRIAWQLNDANAASSFGLLLRNKFPESKEAGQLVQALSTRRYR